MSDDPLETRRLLEAARRTIREIERYIAWIEGGMSRVEVHEDGRWFSSEPGTIVDCARRPVLRRLVVALARARLETPGRGVAVERLLEVAWPGELMRPASGRRRLQVAISRLRALGLGGAIANDADGYLIVPELDVRISPLG